MESNNDLVVRSMSHCFLCLNRISPVKEHVNSEHGPYLQPFSIFSLQNLSGYLKMDLAKVFNDNELIPQHLLDQVRKSKLKGELCEQCAVLNETFSEQYMKLVKIKMEIQSSLHLIQTKLLTALETNKSDNLRHLANSLMNPADGWTGKLDILEVLRLEAIQKCTQRISAESPRPKVQNLTMRQINNKRQKYKLNSKGQTRNLNSISEDTADPEMDCKDANIEVLDPQAGDNDISYYSDNSDTQDTTGSIANEGEKDEGRATGYYYIHQSTARGDDNAKMSTKIDSNTQSSSSSVHVIPPDNLPQINLNPETGKYKCSLCTREFKTKSSVEVHHKSVHLGIKYKCSICGKEFSQSSAFNLHHRTIHMGVGFKCPGCNKIFKRKYLLIAHQRKHGCKAPVTKTEIT